MSRAHRRFIAEWEPIEAVMVALPDQHTDWNYMLPEATDQYRRLIHAFIAERLTTLILCRDADEARARIELPADATAVFITTDYNDTWTRDYGPLCVEKADSVRALDFGFNGWGLKFAADKDNLVNLRLKEKIAILPDAYRNERDFTLEGGSVETDGRGTLLTTSRCLCSPNRNGGKSKAELNDILSARLGCDHILWLDYGALEGDDTDSHIDTLARICPADTIVFTGCRDMDDPQFEELLKMRAQLSLFRTAEGKPFNLVELPLPAPVLDPDDGSRLPATYTNYLIANGNIFMPTYAQPDNDLLAMRTLRIVFPNHKIIPVDCRSLLRQHGSLHCATMQLHPGMINQALV